MSLGESGEEHQPKLTKREVKAAIGERQPLGAPAPFDAQTLAYAAARPTASMAGLRSMAEIVPSEPSHRAIDRATTPVPEAKSKTRSPACRFALRTRCDAHGAKSANTMSSHMIPQDCSQDSPPAATCAGVN